MELNQNKVFIIAEAGVNHNGSLKTAKKLVVAAKYAGADAIKFQTFTADNIAIQTAPKAKYQKSTGKKDESQHAMLKKLELSLHAHKELIKYCAKNRIIFLSSPFDLESIDLLNKLGLSLFKIPSGEITNLPYLKRLGALRKKIILSTGMSNLAEIKKALIVLIKAGTKKQNITVLHCNSAYPSPMRDVNLKAMLTIAKSCRIKIGYSDHTLGLEVPIAAAAMGAAVIEKHFTLDKNMPGPDHKISLDPKEFKKMVDAIRNIEKALGSSIKKISPSECKNRLIARKSIVAKRDIRKGEIFSEQNITLKRPGFGISPILWDKVIGRLAVKEFKKDKFIKL